MPNRFKHATLGLLPPLAKAFFGLVILVCGTANAVELSERQAKLMTNNCIQCHARPDIGVPLMGNPVDWAERNKQGMERMLANVIYGLRGMPPQGYCSACSETDFRTLNMMLPPYGPRTQKILDFMIKMKS